MKIKHPVFSTAVFFAATAANATINIPTVFVGDAGNPNDSSGYGGVSYDYHIGTHEVTNSQYTAFLNATAATDPHGLYNSGMSFGHTGIDQLGTSGSFTYSVRSGFENKPVNLVSFWDAARFTNWLTTGGTETGVYNFNGTTSPTNNTITRDATAWNAGGVAIANENEWHKAAYYGGTGTTYYEYATQSNSITTSDANYDRSVGTVTVVGTYSGDASHYGTFDQGGNVREWTEAIVSSSARSLRGGAFDTNEHFLKFWVTSSGDPATYESVTTGFRVSSLTTIPAPVPEPSAYAAILGCLGLAIATMRRKGRGTR